MSARIAAEVAARINKDTTPNRDPAVIKHGCAVCGKSLKAGYGQTCRKCMKAVIVSDNGKPTRKKPVMAKNTSKKLRKAANKGAVSRAHLNVTGGTYGGTDKGAAMHAMWVQVAKGQGTFGADPALMMAAQQFLAK